VTSPIAVVRGLEGVTKCVDEQLGVRVAEDERWTDLEDAPVCAGAADQDSHTSEPVDYLRGQPRRRELDADQQPATEAGRRLTIAQTLEMARPGDPAPA
jgi:hypothetical protein